MGVLPTGPFLVHQAALSAGWAGKGLRKPCEGVALAAEASGKTAVAWKARLAAVASAWEDYDGA